MARARCPKCKQFIGKTKHHCKATGLTPVTVPVAAPAAALPGHPYSSDGTVSASGDQMRHLTEMLHRVQQKAARGDGPARVRRQQLTGKTLSAAEAGKAGDPAARRQVENVFGKIAWDR